MGCAGGVNGSLGAHEWEGKSARTHMNTFGQINVHIRHHGGTERPEPCACAWFAYVDKSGACVCVVLGSCSAEGTREGGGVHGHGRSDIRAPHLPRSGMAGETIRRRYLLEGSICKKEVGRRGR
jgi:hypothetical protein